MPDYDDDEHSGNVTPRKPRKADYVAARREKGRMALPCRLWQLGHRAKMAPAQWRKVIAEGHSEPKP